VGSRPAAPGVQRPIHWMCDKGDVSRMGGAGDRKFCLIMCQDNIQVIS
jgi:hypothetical protein